VYRRFLVAVLFIAMGALTVLPAANGGAEAPDRVSLTVFRPTRSYPVKVDVTGHVDFDWTWDSLRDCAPG
jgi:hypothetical protein